MAAAAPAPSQTDSNSETASSKGPPPDLKCPVCLDYYDDPKLLPCGHLACRKCLVHWLQAPNMPKTCPACRGAITDDMPGLPANTMTPEELCDALPTDVSMVSLVGAERKLQGPHVCEKCGQVAPLMCLTCSLKLCRVCCRKHAKAVNKRVAKAEAKREAAVAKAGGRTDLGLDEDHPNIPYVAPRRHVTKPLSELDAMTVIRNREERCPDHSQGEGDKWQDYYCHTHKAGLCRQCVIQGHGQCAVGTSAAKLEEDLKLLAQQRERLEEHERRLQREYEELDRKEKEAEEESENVLTRLDTEMDKLLSELHTARDQLKKTLQRQQQPSSSSESLTPEDRVQQQTSLLQSFRDQMMELVSMKEAEGLVRGFGDYSQKLVEEVKGKRASGGAPHVSTQDHHHHHHQHPHHHHHHQRHHHHHHHHQHQRQHQNQPQLAAESRPIQNHLSSEVEGAVTDLEPAILPSSTVSGGGDSASNTATGVASDDHPDGGDSAGDSATAGASDDSPTNTAASSSSAADAAP